MHRLRLTPTGLFWVILLVITPLSVSAALAADKQVTLHAEWSYDADETLITGYKIKDADGVVVADVAIPTARTASWAATTDGKTCQPYYMVAYAEDGEESGPSNVAQFCPVRTPLKAVGTFEIELKP